MPHEPISKLRLKEHALSRRQISWHGVASAGPVRDGPINGTKGADLDRMGSLC